MKLVMGIKDVFKSASKPVREIDSERLVDRFAELRLQPLSELEARDRTKVCGEVKRLSLIHI